MDSGEKKKKNLNRHLYSIKKLLIFKIVVSKYIKMQSFTNKDKNKNKIMFY